MIATTTATITLVHQNCGACHRVFGMEWQFREAALADHSITWHCPYCGSQHMFTGKTKEQRLREMLESANARASRLEGEKKLTAHQLRAQKAAKTRIKNRVARGVCPCCNRSFENLRRHMANQHPDYQKTEA